MVVSVRTDARAASRCTSCHRRCPGWNQRVRVRRWRKVDIADTRTYLQAAASRVRCVEHGVQVAQVPWGRPGAKCSYLLEDT